VLGDEVQYDALADVSIRRIAEVGSFNCFLIVAARHSLITHADFQWRGESHRNVGPRLEPHLLTARGHNGTGTGGAANRGALRGAALAADNRANDGSSSGAYADLGCVFTLRRASDVARSRCGCECGDLPG
jgi:hypothetical protein